MSGERSTCSPGGSWRKGHAAPAISSMDSSSAWTALAKNAAPDSRRIGVDLPFPEQHFALFVIFSWNYEVLLTAIESYVAAGFGRRIIIIDNSPERLIAGDDRMKGMVGEVIPTRTRLTFSQSQNFIADISIERDYDYYFWGHSDVAVLARHANTSFAGDVLACVEAAMTATPDWGIIYFAYDWFSAIRTDLVRQVQYDTFITVYKSDCDFYPRVRAAGFQTLNYPQVCPALGRLGKVYDLNNPVRVPWGKFKAAKAVLEADEAARGYNRMEWKFKHMPIGELLGWEMWERSSTYYFQAKWGRLANPWDACRMERVSGLSGKPSLPQQPFSGLQFVQRGNWMERDWLDPQGRPEAVMLKMSHKEPPG